MVAKQVSCIGSAYRLRSVLFLRFHSSWDGLRRNDNITKQRIRYQEYTPLGKTVMKGGKKPTSPSSHVIFKIMDYNILSHTHMMTHIKNYKDCPRQCLNWGYRKSVLKDELLAENPDIFCLQEVEEKHKDDFIEHFRILGFDALYVPRGEDKPDGCAILYRTSLFQAVDFSPVHFLRPEVPLLDRPNVGMVIKLQLRNHPGNYLVVANTHLLYNPRRVDIKLCQLVMLLAETERLAYNNCTSGPNKFHPVILTGDLNVNPDSDLITLLTEGSLNFPEKCTKSQQKKTVLSAEMLSQSLNISESCQYLDVLEARGKGLDDPRLTKDLKGVLQEHRVCPGLDSNIECSNPHFSIPHKGNSKKENYHDSVEFKGSKSISPGSLNHCFPLNNVYSNHLLDKLGKGQSKNNKLNVYDYMFYSCHHKCLNSSLTKLRPGQLQLLSRLRLPSVSEYYSQIKSLPNFACASDHLPLVASFLLPLQ